ncbi:hypothetical protein [Halobacterium salinarum]|uniref:hypothetical protein n=1 Tax=Halobacterium salinarum TaxID=2242 RepID=UPI002553B428|nr:hypothetical protein [Halobacterium salinarum]MDL0142721.1 hypothetical protein [Halobacterium salinarum]
MNRRQFIVSGATGAIASLCGCSALQSGGLKVVSADTEMGETDLTVNVAAKNTASSKKSGTLVVEASDDSKSKKVEMLGNSDRVFDIVFKDQFDSDDAVKVVSEPEAYFADN